MQNDKELYLQMIRDFANKGFNNISALVNEQVTNKAIQGYILFSVLIRMYLTVHESWKQTNPKSTMLKKMINEQKKDLSLLRDKTQKRNRKRKKG